MNEYTAYLLSLAVIGWLIWSGRQNRKQGWRKPAGGSLQTWRDLLARSDAGPETVTLQTPAVPADLAALGSAVRHSTPQWEPLQTAPEKESSPR